MYDLLTKLPIEVIAFEIPANNIVTLSIPDDERWIILFARAETSYVDIQIECSGHAYSILDSEQKFVGILPLDSKFTLRFINTDTNAHYLIVVYLKIIMPR